MTMASSSPPCFADRLVRDVERGEWRDGETRYLLLRHDSLMGMFRRLAPRVRGEALAALAAAVTEAGGRSAARYRATTPGGSAALLEVIAETAAQLGWGVWTFAQPADGELCLDVVNSPFARVSALRPSRCAPPSPAWRAPSLRPSWDSRRWRRKRAV